MSLSNVTTTFNVHDLFGANFDARRAKAWATTNAPDDTIHDKSTGETRIGGGTATINPDGTGTFTHWAPGADGNPTTWQTTYHFDVPDRTTGKGRRVEHFGPFTVTTSGLLTALVQEQIAIPTATAAASAAAAGASATSAAGSASSAATSASAASTARTGAEAARAGAEAAEDAAQALVLSDLGTTDGQTRALIENPASQTAGALSATSVSPSPGGYGATLMQTYAQDDGRINAKDKRLGTWGSEASVINALDAAEDGGLRKGTPVFFPPGPFEHVYDVGDGLDMTGRTSVLQGGGAYCTSGGDWFGTVFKASTQTGPVIDLEGWEPPAAFQGRVSIGGFAVLGSGLGDPTKNNAGIRVKILGSTLLHDIAIAETGGPCLEAVANPGNAQYLSSIARLTLNTPIDVQANDVPWLYFAEPNLMLMSEIGFRHIGPGPGSVGASGAAIIDSPPGVAPSGGSTFSDWWMENLWVPDHGTLISSKGNFHTFRDCRFVDCYREPGAEETSFVTFHAPGTGDEGGNLWRGFMFGRDPDRPASTVDYGIDNRQSFNAFDGVKGRKGYNVVHRGSATPGTVGTFSDIIHNGVTLRGSQLFNDGPGVIDQSPSATGAFQNRHIDYCTGDIKGFTVTA